VDVLGREWKGPSITLQGLGSAVFTIGRSLFDSIDRTVGLLIEKHEGQVPFHLAPEQIRVVSVGVAELTYAETIVNECCANGFRAEWDSREDQLGTKIHSAEKERIPYIIIIGEKERGQNRISVRHFEQKHKNQFVTLNEFLSDLKHLKGCEST
jgi:threonyl-tRNA synthetase